ncbi:ABC transporter ATP-binding protein [Chitinivibrio alkaliphilus]|uniref:ABC-type transport system, ATPase component n=1 Tax=Chitinivibrio alkaliphilus ACht1 TaxID=1313304 RepID=U7DAZ9_9BACT|nr:ABC transporter ATP-binding protein [Chitinivibrio alkaliphilus]ERP31580.1 ABC-type transport system, ATPase component [Chitinivibrio alkaliphilus ACht1]
MAGLILRNIHKRFGNNTVIPNLNLEIQTGEFVTLLGPSGCGKTTLLRMIAGLEKINSGELYIGGKYMNPVPPQKRPIGMVFQSYALFPHMNVRNNIAFGLKIQKKDRADIFTKLDWVLPLLGLEKYTERLPKQLSGGQRQRVALARALVLDPDVLLLDEPLSNLDAALREKATEELKRIHMKVGKTIIYVTHNQIEAMTMSHRIAVMRNGQVEQYDKPSVLYDSPATYNAACFIGSPVTNTLTGTLKTDGKDAILHSSIGPIRVALGDSPALQKYDGVEVLASIRPQDIRLKTETNSSVANLSTEISVRVEMTETPGDRSLIIARAGKNDATTIRFFVHRSRHVSRGDLQSILIPGNRLHLYDTKTKMNIRHEEQYK